MLWKNKAGRSELGVLVGAEGQGTIKNRVIGVALIELVKFEL